MEHDVCQAVMINSEQVAVAEKQMPAAAELQRLSATFKLLGDPTRLKILHALKTTELCVCDLAALLETTSSAVSHQLRLLRRHGLVKFRRAGKVVYYSLASAQTGQLLAGLKLSGKPQD